ncbi:hypothetical protein AMTR_s00022p00250700 [Amborella trichopoda]|uniref:Uncharacterized protein n=1 Tax=Amborella trichopoda TaxID=13333 RepID=W1PWP1_AMBTC|nr:hypothetical protein AMTR_s00022p00250700 [Amborella trichopoda]
MELSKEISSARLQECGGTSGRLQKPSEHGDWLLALRKKKLTGRFRRGRSHTMPFTRFLLVTHYVKAKHVQLVDKDPNRAIALFWSAINHGDRVDSALKDMATVMKQVNRAEEEIEAIKSFRHLCSDQAQESLDNVLLDLHKRCGHLDDQIELLKHRLKMIKDGEAFSGKKTEIARSQGKKFHVSLEQEVARILGNLGWVYMQQGKFEEAESEYRKALAIEPDNTMKCNLAICLMQKGRIAEAKTLLDTVKPASMHSPGGESH